MTPQDYISAGYEMGAQKPQPEIDKAERDVIEAYVKPILPNYNEDDCTTRQAIMALAFLLILQRNIVATRGGARVKTGVNSMNQSGDAILQQMAYDCDTRIVALRQLTGANKDAKVRDICRIYFVTNYFYI